MMKTLAVLLVLLGSVHAGSYTVTTYTAGLLNAGTRSQISITLKGTKSHFTKKLEKKMADKQNVDTFTITDGEALGDLTGVTLSTAGQDTWMVGWVTVQPEDGEVMYFYNTGVKTLSTDPKKGVPSLDMVEQGKAKYLIYMTTACVKGAKADFTGLTIKIEGKKGVTETGLLNQINNNNWESGNTDVFVVQGMKDVGHVTCIEMEVRSEDMWLFTVVELHKVGDELPNFFINYDKTRMSTDPAQGVSTIKLCNEKCSL